MLIEVRENQPVKDHVTNCWDRSQQLDMELDIEKIISIVSWGGYDITVSGCPFVINLLKWGLLSTTCDIGIPCGEKKIWADESEIIGQQSLLREIETQLWKKAFQFELPSVVMVVAISEFWAWILVVATKKNFIWDQSGECWSQVVAEAKDHHYLDFEIKIQRSASKTFRGKLAGV